MKYLLIFLISFVGSQASFVPTSRIIGGADAEDGQFPHQISLKVLTVHICGGSIIKPKFILTAAHCVDGAVSKDMTVVAGTNKQSVIEPFIQVSTYNAHQEYNLWKMMNDIAIVRLSKELTYDSKVQPIALNTDFTDAGVQCVLSGWGSIKYPGVSPENLQFINLVTIDIDECAGRLSSFGLYVGQEQVCTLTVRGEGACQGDSGGPLISGNQQIGVVSWGRPCAIGYPDVYTRVSAYIDWISIYSK
ncbi:hypothetical protein FQR65_LT02143 [Abscondita terminalis]|nr:hypothetical protein FQR65_LT02143 [Abscondita terminalis]